MQVLGVVPRSDYVQLVRAAALIVQPSRYEGWSSVVEDARALRKRIVLSDIAVHLEQAPPGGIYFRTGDATAFAGRIVEGLEVPLPADERTANDRPSRADQCLRVRADVHANRTRSCRGSLRGAPRAVLPPLQLEATARRLPAAASCHDTGASTRLAGQRPSALGLLSVRRATSRLASARNQ